MEGQSRNGMRFFVDSSTFTLKTEKEVSLRIIGSHLCGYTMSPAPKSAKINALDKRGILTH
jgi:hypothetical protein